MHEKKEEEEKHEQTIIDFSCFRVLNELFCKGYNVVYHFDTFLNSMYWKSFFSAVAKSNAVNARFWEIQKKKQNKIEITVGNEKQNANDIKRRNRGALRRVQKRHLLPWTQCICPFGFNGYPGWIFNFIRFKLCCHIQNGRI